MYTCLARNCDFRTDSNRGLGVHQKTCKHILPEITEAFAKRARDDEEREESRIRLRVEADAERREEIALPPAPSTPPHLPSSSTAQRPRRRARVPARWANYVPTDKDDLPPHLADAFPEPPAIGHVHASPRRRSGGAVPAVTPEPDSSRADGQAEILSAVDGSELLANAPEHAPEGASEVNPEPAAPHSEPAMPERPSTSQDARARVTRQHQDVGTSRGSEIAHARLSTGRRTCARGRFESDAEVDALEEACDLDEEGELDKEDSGDEEDPEDPEDVDEEVDADEEVDPDEYEEDEVDENMVDIEELEWIVERGQEVDSVEVRVASR
ncbi:hypothetical protein C8Q78DRAFT_1082631 [Trametes maxima]|nr:hypothetical protein C8Q78DRAFT_1082631 [Trametes maxima]